MHDLLSIGVVTGAGSGIGRAVALALAQEGYALSLLGRRKDKLEETAHLAKCAQALVLPTDIRDPNQVRQAFSGTAEKFGRIDILFNNAGISAPSADIDELTTEQWLNVIQININGTFFCSREAFAIMRKQEPRGGRIINNGSISAHSPRPKSAAYTVSKHAMTGLTKSLALDGRPYDIACGQIDIGNASTDLAQQIAIGMPQADGSRRPEPMMAVDEVAKAVLMMAALPLTTNVQFMTILATNMPFVGRG